METERENWISYKKNGKMELLKPPEYGKVILTYQGGVIVSHEIRQTFKD